ncbi:MAG: VOC family protein [Chloroflexi bacterium]|nr:VOC family protein [Chloroflexota bacterium]
MSKHHIVHIEFSANDREAAGKFFSDVFDWEVQQMPEMNYAMFNTGDDLGGGLNPVGENSPVGRVLVHIGTDDIEATSAKIEANGGKITVPKTEIPAMGWFAIFTDPTGNEIGLYQAMKE